MNKRKIKQSRFSRGNVIAICTITSVVVLIGFFAQDSLRPVNSDGLVFAPSTSIFLKAVKSTQENFYYQHVKGGKNTPSIQGVSPSIIVPKGNLVQIHLINEEKNERDNLSKDNLHIDEFNVHTKDLSYFQTDSVTFFADKEGTFDYYSSVHPKMRGTITISGN